MQVFNYCSLMLYRRIESQRLAFQFGMYTVLCVTGDAENAGVDNVAPSITAMENAGRWCPKKKWNMLNDKRIVHDKI